MRSAIVTTAAVLVAGATAAPALAAGSAGVEYRASGSWLNAIDQRQGGRFTMTFSVVGGPRSQRAQDFDIEGLPPGTLPCEPGPTPLNADGSFTAGCNGLQTIIIAEPTGQGYRGELVTVPLNPQVEITATWSARAPAATATVDSGQVRLRGDSIGVPVRCRAPGSACSVQVLLRNARGTLVGSAHAHLGNGRRAVVGVRVARRALTPRLRVEVVTRRPGVLRPVRRTRTVTLVR